MTPKEIEVVQRSFAKVAPIADTAAKLFYERLFELDPSLRPLFKTDMDEQGHRLMTMIAAAVEGLGNLETLVPVVQELGRRHVGYGVKPKHYDIVGQALLETLEKGLGPEFTPEVKAAWTSAYTVLSGTMIDAAA